MRTATICLLVSAATACPFSDLAAPSTRDSLRASRLIPGQSFVAKGASAIRKSLNQHLKNGPVALPRPQPCEKFSLKSLHELESDLHCRRNKRLIGYADARRPRHASLKSLQAEHKADEQYAAENPEVAEALRDGKCHELAMQWVHHLSEETRRELSGNSKLSLPLLPAKGLDEHAPALNLAGHQKITAKVKARVTCQIGHEANITARGKWEGFPHWPYEVTYNASGYGPYPFWTLGGGSGGSLSGKGTDIQTWWSAVLNSERLDHASCNMAGVGAKDGVPCTHLFINNSFAFLFTQDKSFCCMSSAPKQYTKCHLTRPQRTFMDVMKYNGIINYTSEDGLYKGSAKKYSMHLTSPSNFWFWYITDMDDKPIEQGEGPCDMYSAKGTRECSGPPKMLFHQYHPGTFKEATLDPSVFAVPDICKKTPRKHCMVQPTSFCGDDDAASDDEAANQITARPLPHFH